MSNAARRQLLVQVGELLFAADAREAREVLDRAEATPVPGAVPGVLGLINRRGKVMVAGELAPLLGVRGSPGEESAFIVLEHGGRQVALGVDRVVGVATYRPEDLDVPGELLEALGAREIVAGVGRFEDRPYFQLDVEALFARVLMRASEHDGTIRAGSGGGQER